MAAVGALVLVLCLLVSAHCEVRARDPEVEQEEEEEGGRAAGGGGLPPPPKKLQPRVSETPPQSERGDPIVQNGNWCGYIQSKKVMVTEKCGTKKFSIRSQSPCSSGNPDCQIVLYKLATRPLYQQTQKVITSLVWSCCSGHTGDNCELTDKTWLQHHQGDQEAGGPRHIRHHDNQHNPNPTWEPSTTPYPQPEAEEEEEELLPDDIHPPVLHYPQSPGALSLPHLMALVLSQLEPTFQGFNRSLEHLSQQVGALSRDVALLKEGRRVGAELDEALEDGVEVRLEEVVQNIREVQAQLENRLDSQHALLKHNLSSLRSDVDLRLSRHQEALKAINRTLSQLEPDRTMEASTPPPPPLPSDPSALWDAIERLDNMVVNNTVKVGGLMEDVAMAAGGVQQLQRECRELEQRLDQTARKSQVLFMETGLEVEDAKVAVLRRVEELAGNLTQYHKQLQETEVDVDYLYQSHYQNVSTQPTCDCQDLKAAMTQLERGVANVTALANDNRLALDESSEGEAEQWGEALEALQRGLRQVEEALVLEQTRTRTLDLSVAQLSSSMLALKEPDRKLREDVQHLAASFRSLLKDAVRHSDVLELLLGEEVLEFLDWPVQDQEANSIPALREQLRLLQEQVRDHHLSITALLSNQPGNRDEVPSADQPSSPHLLPDDWHLVGVGRSHRGEAARERQLLLPTEGRVELGGDGSDLWNLERQVEQLELRVGQVEEKTCTCNSSSHRAEPDEQLQAEVRWLKRGLEEHLRVFKNVFRNADVLMASDAALDLDQLWHLLKREGGKRERRRGAGGGNPRNRRESPGAPPVLSDQSEISLVFVGKRPRSVSNFLVFRSSLSQSLLGSSFTAPVGGVYLFVLTLDLSPGPAHVVLRRGQGKAQVSLLQQEVMEVGPVTGVGLLLLKEGEQVRLELCGGVWGESEDNVFTGLLLHQTT